MKSSLTSSIPTISKGYANINTLVLSFDHCSRKISHAPNKRRGKGRTAQEEKIRSKVRPRIKKSKRDNEKQKKQKRKKEWRRFKTKQKESREETLEKLISIRRRISFLWTYSKLLARGVHWRLQTTLLHELHNLRFQYIQSALGPNLGNNLASQLLSDIFVSSMHHNLPSATINFCRPCHKTQAHCGKILHNARHGSKSIQYECC